MDNMALSMDSPQEDELAVNVSGRLDSFVFPPHITSSFEYLLLCFVTAQVLSACTSAYAPVCFMTKEPFFRRFFTMEEASDAEKRR